MRWDPAPSAWEQAAVGNQSYIPSQECGDSFEGHGDIAPGWSRTFWEDLTEDFGCFGTESQGQLATGPKLYCKILCRRGARKREGGRQLETGALRVWLSTGLWGTGVPGPTRGRETSSEATLQTRSARPTGTLGTSWI